MKHSLPALAITCTALIANLSFASDRPNVILVMCDDMGYGDPQCFNPQSHIKTPNIDAMAAAGMKFTRFYAQAPVCSPTRGSCLTGRHPYRYGVYSANVGHMKKDEITLPEMLKKEGYATGHFGKWHLGVLTTKINDANRGGPRGKKHFSTPTMHGYDVCLVTESKVPTFDPMIKPKDAGRKAWDYIKDKSKAVNYGTRYWNEQGEVVTENLDGDDSRIVMDRAATFIESAVDRKQPFFAAIWFHAPHLPVVAGPDHVKPYEKFGVHERNYYGCVAAIDEQVGRLRTLLKSLNVADNTLLCFCSDNGPEGGNKDPGLPGPLRGRKRSLYEGGVRVPGIIEWPARIRDGQTTDFAAVTSDYFPTVLAALNIDMPDDRPIDGVSLLPVFDGQATARSRGLGFQSSKQLAWHEGRYKLYSGDKGKTWELYDLNTDIGEQKNLARSMPERTSKMRQALQKWVGSCKQSDAGEDY